MFPKTENEREFLGRIQRLEVEQFGGTKEQNYHRDSGRRDTGRTDEFSDENPQKDYDDYRAKYPKEIIQEARETAQKISNDGIPNQHIGNHSTETIEQEIYSLMNIDMNFRRKKWNNRFRVVSANLAKMRNEIPEAKFNELLLLMNEIIGGKTVAL